MNRLLGCIILLMCSDCAAGKVLVIVADDVGVADISAYGIGRVVPPTPNIDAMVSSGVLFKNTWSMPVCTPTRACIQTGRYGFRTGVGSVDILSNELPFDEITLPETLSVPCGAFGKWHLGDSSPRNPNLHGYDDYYGALRGGVTNYYAWGRTVNGITLPSTTYVTTASVDDTLTWLEKQSGDWFCYLCFNAAHIPLHEPPLELHSYDLTGVTPAKAPMEYFDAMIEAMDSEIGRLLEQIDLSDTTVIFVGDNGNSHRTTQPPFSPFRSKGTVYEGGVWVPLIVCGNGVVDGGREVAHMTNVVDIFATVVELLGGEQQTGIDSFSLVPYLTDPEQDSLRTFNYTETFTKYPFLSTALNARAIRSERFKLIQRPRHSDELYDLQEDRFEKKNVIRRPEHRQVVAMLRMWMEELTGEAKP